MQSKKQSTAGKKSSYLVLANDYSLYLSCKKFYEHGKKIIVWGAGGKSAHLLRNFPDLRNSVIRIVDSNYKNIGKLLGEYEVETPDIIKHVPCDAIVVAVALSQHKSEIVDTIRNVYKTNVEVL